MRFLRVFLLLFMLFCVMPSVCYAAKTELTEQEKTTIKADAERKALKESGYSDEQINAYQKTINERVAMAKKGKKLPKLSKEYQEMSKVASKARRKANAQIAQENKRLQEKNGGNSNNDDHYYNNNDDDDDDVEDTLYAVGMGGAAVGGGALAMAGAIALGATPLGWGIAAGLAGAALGAWIYDSIWGEDKPPTFERVLSSFTSLSQGSWFSPVFTAIFNATNALTAKLNTNLARSVVKILYLLMMFYILFTVMKAVVSFSPIEPSKLISELFFPLGRCLLAVWAISNWQVVFDEIITPLLKLGIVFGNEIIKTVHGSQSYMASLAKGKVPISITCSVTSGSGGLDISVCNTIQAFLTTVSQNLIVWMAIGATFIVDSWGNGAWKIFPSFSMIFIGLMIFIFAFMIYVSFPLKLIDTLFRIMFVMALFPLWCAFWVIPQTRNYSKSALNMFLNVLATFICASVVLVMVISILESMFKGIDFSGVVSLLQEDKSRDAMEKIGFSTSSLFYSTCLSFMAFHLVGKIEYFTNLFVKQDSLGIGAGVSKATTVAVQSSPKLVGMAKNATAWGLGKTATLAKGAASLGKEALNRARAKSYNNNAPGGSARQSPRLWTANPLTEKYDRYKAKKAGTGYTGDVQVGKVQKGADGSTSQTYSNTTYDKDNNVKARMQETTTSNADKSKQSVNRNVTHLNADGSVRQTANVKKDFENGQAVRKTTTMKDKNGNRVDISVDKNTGLATKTKYDASGNKLSTETRARGGERTLETNNPDGSVRKEVRDKDGDVRSRSTTNSDGSKTTLRYSKEKLSNGNYANFERLKKDTLGNITEHMRFDIKNNSFTNMLTGVKGKYTDLVNP